MLTETPPVEAHIQYAVRLGIHGQIGKLRASELSQLQRGQRVLCRTSRGLEIGEILTGLDPFSDQLELADGIILRKVTSEDEFLASQLKRLAEDLHSFMQEELSQADPTATLLEVESLMDGKTLFFHFLGPVNDQAQGITDRLGKIFQKKARESRFAQLLETGCGPGCGTTSSKCGTTGGCSTCVIAGGCSSKKQST